MTLSGVPAATPVAGDFTFTAATNGGTAGAVTVGGFAWVEATLVHVHAGSSWCSGSEYSNRMQIQDGDSCSGGSVYFLASCGTDGVLATLLTLP